MKRIYIENINDYIIVDDKDFTKVNKHKWHINFSHQSERAIAWIEGKKICLPTYITNKAYSYQKVKNLDFTRENIGIDHYHVRYRKPQKNASSKFKGVRKVKYKSGNCSWVSSICVNGERIHLGCFEGETDAAQSYNDAVHKYWDGNGYLNVIEE